MKPLHRNLWLIATVLLAAVLTVVAFSHIVTAPWRILPDIGGDGAKNNLTYLYHSIYGHGYWFDGMNYPYGEHIVFTDGIPLLSVFFAAVGNVGIPTALTTLWWLLGLSYILSSVYLYKLLLRLTISPAFSVVVGLLITFLTPQIICIRGHYALAFTCVIPMLFYWTWMYHTERNSKYCIYILVLGVLSAFLHPYYAGMLLVWTAVYSLGYFIVTRASIKETLTHTGKLIAATAAVAVIVMLFIKLTDPATDRPITPYNPTDSYTHLSQIFTSRFSLFWDVAVNKSIVPKASDGGEGFSYPGMVPLCVLFAALVISLYRWVMKIKNSQSGPDMRLWLFMALGVLAFSMGIPFIWHMQWLMDYLPVFRQFRALGRFAWIFYYVITVCASVIMYGWFAKLLKQGSKRWAMGLMVLAIGVWATEVSGYMKLSRQRANEGAYNYDVIMQTYERDWTTFLAEHKFSGTDFQAVLLLKFFHIGTEKIWVGDPGWLITLGSRAALQLHLPIVDVMMSRSSWGQAQKQVMLVAGPYAAKPMLEELTDNKPFLMMRFNEDSLSPDDSYLLQASEYIGEFSQCSIYACYPSRILANDKRHHDSVAAILPFVGSGDTCVGSMLPFVALHYDGNITANNLHGGGAGAAINGNDSIVAILPLAVANRQQYEFSVWFLLHREDCRSPEVRLDMADGAGTIIGTEMVNCKESTDSKGLWFRASKYLYLPAGCREVRCTVLNLPNPTYAAMDELLLRPAESVIISRAADNGVMVNGHLFENAR